MDVDKELHALLERAATLMAKAGFRSCAVNVRVAGKEKMYGFMESSFYMDMMKRKNPPRT